MLLALTARLNMMNLECHSHIFFLFFFVFRLLLYLFDDIAQTPNFPLAEATSLYAPLKLAQDDENVEEKHELGPR